MTQSSSSLAIMDIDGLCLSIIDDIVFKVEQQHQMADGNDLNLAEELESSEDNVIKLVSPSYNLHEFNDLYPHYPITPGKIIKNYLFQVLSVTLTNSFAYSSTYQNSTIA